MRRRSCSPLALGTFLGLGLLACGGSAAQVEPESQGAANPVIEDDQEAVIVSRTAEVPKAAEGDRVVFLRAGSVWMMGPDGEDPEQLTVRSLEAADEHPRVSPDGSHLVYSSGKDGKQRLYLQSMEEMIPMPVSEGVDREPAWSPDNRTLAFMRGDERVKLDLYTLEVGGEGKAEPRLLLEGDDDHPQRAGAPIWSADGSSIVLSADRREHRGTSLWRVDVASGALKRITGAPNDAPWASDRSPVLSPDGTRIAFVSNRHASSSDSADDFDLYSIALDGSGLTRLTDDPGTVAHPAYSSDGKRLYFASTRVRQADFEWEIYVMAAGGGEQRRLTRDARPENYAPSVTRPGSSQ